MYKGRAIRWGVWREDHELYGKVHIELLKEDFDKKELSILIDELMDIRRRVPEAA